MELNMKITLDATNLNRSVKKLKRKTLWLKLKLFFLNLFCERTPSKLNDFIKKYNELQPRMGRRPNGERNQ